jgi:hypothetical protein
MSRERFHEILGEFGLATLDRMSPGMDDRDDMRRAARLIVALAMLAGCAADTYPIHAGAGASQSSIATVGTPVQAVVLFVQLRPGDRIEFVSAEAVGVADGANTKLFVSPAVLQESGDWLTGSVLEELAGAEFTAKAPTANPENQVGIVAEVTASRAGRYQMTAVRLSYRLNGGHERVAEGADVIFTLCAGRPLPAGCEEFAQP